MRRRAAWSWVLAGAVTALALGTNLVAAARSYLWAPYSDPHGWIASVFAAEASGSPWRVVFAPFNQQRIPLVLLTQLLDVEGVRGRAPSFLLLGVVAWCSGIAAVAWVLARTLPARVAAGLVAAAALILGHIAVAEDLAFPVFSVYPVVAGFAAVAFAAMSAAPARIGAFVCGLLAATAACLGNAAGLAVWPVLIFWATVERRNGRQQAVLWVTAVLVIGALEWGLGSPSGAASANGHPAARLLKMGQYLAGFAGLWWGAVAHPQPGRVVGLVVLVVAVAGLFRPTVEGDAGRVQRLGRMVTSFGLLTAALATLGRVDELPEPIVPTRYFPFAALLQLGALLCWSALLTTVARSRPRAAAVATLAVAVLTLGSQLKGARALVATSRMIQASGRAFDAGDRSPAVVRLVDAHPDMDAAVRAELHRRGLPW